MSPTYSESFLEFPSRYQSSYGTRTSNGSLNILYYSKGTCELGLAIFQAVNAAAEEETSRCVKGESVDEIIQSDRCSSGVTSQHWQEFLHMVLESVEVRDSVLDELRSEKSARIVP